MVFTFESINNIFPQGDFQASSLTPEMQQEVTIFVGCCCFVWFIYYSLAKVMETTKQKAWIIMLQSTFTLSICGTIALMLNETYNLWNQDFMYSDSFWPRVVLLYFTATNVMDLAIGYVEYPKYLDPLSTIFHHIVYIGLALHLLRRRTTNGFMIMYFMEIPTFLLSLGTIWPKYRLDLSFGVIFFVTRIAYNIYVIYRLFVVNYAMFDWLLGIGTLILHSFWFSKWIAGYRQRAKRL